MTVSISTCADREAWNSFIASVSHTHFHQSWEWGELAPDLGGKAVRLAATNDGEMLGAAQVFVNRLHRLPKTQLYIPRGPAAREPRMQVLGPLLDACRGLADDNDAAGIKIEPNAPDDARDWKSALESLGLSTTFPPSQPRSSWLLDISPDAEAILAGMKSKTRYNVRLAERKGVEVAEGTPADLDAFYRLYQETAIRDDFFIQPCDFYRRMFTLFSDSGRFCLLLARYKKELIAAVTLVVQGNTCWYVHGGSGNQHRNLMATYLLQWRAMLWAKTQQCALYDFRAVPDVLQEDQDMYGVYRFKEGFGGYHYTTLPTYAMPYEQGLYRVSQGLFAARFAVQQRRRRRQGLPIRQFA